MDHILYVFNAAWKNQVAKSGNYLQELICPLPSASPYLQVKSKTRLNACV